MAYLKIIYFYVFSVLTTIIFCALVILTGFLRRLKFVQSDNREIEHNFATLWAKTIVNYMPGWNISIIGNHNIPKTDQPYVIIANHESLADIWMLYLLGMQFKWLSKIENFNVPLFGQAMHECGYIAIKRGNKESAALAMDLSAQWLKRGVPMLFFPEGTRSRTPGIIGDFKIGAFKLASACDVPILPIALSGAGELIRKGSLFPQDANIVIKVLPLEYMQPDEDPEIFRDRIRNLVVNAHGEISRIRAKASQIKIKNPVKVWR